MPHPIGTAIICSAIALVVLAGPAEADEPFGSASAVPEGDLATLRGGETANQTFAIAVANQSISTTNGSSFNAGGDVTNGDVNIGSGALRNAGLGNYLLNTGIGSNLVAALNISITITNAPIQ